MSTFELVVRAAEGPSSIAGHARDGSVWVPVGSLVERARVDGSECDGVGRAADEDTSTWIGAHEFM